MREPAYLHISVCIRQSFPLTQFDTSCSFRQLILLQALSLRFNQPNQKGQQNLELTRKDGDAKVE